MSLYFHVGFTVCVTAVAVALGTAAAAAAVVLLMWMFCCFSLVDLPYLQLVIIKVPSRLKTATSRGFGDVNSFVFWFSHKNFLSRWIIKNMIYKCWGNVYRSLDQ